MMQVIYYEDEIPEIVNRSIFLAGPTPRSEDIKSWRPEALRILENRGYDGVVYVPESRRGCFSANIFAKYDGMVEWEKRRLNQADIILFWVPRNMENLHGFTTNVEFGHWVKSGKCIYGRPEHSPHTGYLDWMYTDITNRIPKDNLEATIEEAIYKEQFGMDRKGGERFVPLQIWKTETFQRWYHEHTKVGNTLDDARLLWSFIPRKSVAVFSFVLWVKIWIKEEQRHKENEWIFARRDISTVVLHSKNVYNPDIILVKEFRSPVRNKECFVFENPGGSSAKPNENMYEIAKHEVEEETSLIIVPERIIYYGSKQLCGTLSTHHSQLFGCELTDEEMEKAKAIASSGKSFGIESDSEKTYLYVCKATELFDLGVDWATIGMVYAVLENRDLKFSMQ